MTDFTTTPVFDCLDTWLDEEPRTGAMNMAIDQLLMEHVADVPVLRVYRWSEPTVSVGYFMSLASAKAEFPSAEVSDEGLHYIRRWTGGGVVDHRDDVTYTLVIPKAHSLAMARGEESYQRIHQSLATSLAAMGENVQIFRKSEAQDKCGCACFTNPVNYDLLGENDQKIAGAGQKRTRQGLLHQGSVSLNLKEEIFLRELAKEMGQSTTTLKPDRDFFLQAERLASQRYKSADWLEKK